jgi:hypothetical protein
MGALLTITEGSSALGGPSFVGSKDGATTGGGGLTWVRSGSGGSGLAFIGVGGTGQASEETVDVLGRIVAASRTSGTGESVVSGTADSEVSGTADKTVGGIGSVFAAWASTGGSSIAGCRSAGPMAALGAGERTGG